MTDPSELRARIAGAIARRFGVDTKVPDDTAGLDEIARIVEHYSLRRFAAKAVAPDLLRLLMLAALSAPSKSDLQQADIVHVADPEKRRTIQALIPDMPWIADAPVFLVFCANHRRLRQISEWRGKEFANRHLDHFMNAAVDAAIVMTTFIRAAEAVGLGCCPISVIRNHAQLVSDLLALPDLVFPVAGLCVGWPGIGVRVTPRLSPEVTTHCDRFDETDLRAKIAESDRRRESVQRFARQRDPERFGEVKDYGWAEDKARQYAKPERTDFGAFIRRKGFSLD